MMTYMFWPMAMSTTCFTRAIQSAGILVEPSVMWQFQDAGMRMALKPAAFTELIERLVGGRIAPGGFAAVRLERVAEVPAEVHLAGDLLRGRKSLGRSGN